ncbi:hypothetical protein [Microbacterium oleivorans]|uniref:hypothetical protein n=1 Tax=Microbacterium oleivorans TaxID=273677 RepID=UPI00080E9934|nr:hypothetical protein [Microbacterium oleivorans]
MTSSSRRRRLLATATAALALTGSSLLFAAPAQAAGSFALNEPHFFLAPAIVSPGMITPVSAALGNNSNATPAEVTISFGLRCYSPGQPTVDGLEQTVVIPADTSRPAGARQLVRVADVIAVPTSCTKPAGPIPLRQDGYFWIKMTQPGAPDQMKMVPITIVQGDN